MLKKGDRVAVGLSGGKDSTVLLHSLVLLQKDLPFEIVAVTINEGIENYREKTLEVAKRECENLGVEQVVLSFKDASGKTLDEIQEKDTDLPCTNCGVLRRYLLNKGAREAGANKLATGHNLDDLAQTVLLNVFRNEPSRLARLNDPIVEDEKFVRRIRPLMMTPEKEVAIYAFLKGIEIDRVDCPYAKYAFRGFLRETLNRAEEKYPGTKHKIAGTFLEIEDALRAKYMKNAELSYCRSCGDPTSNEICMYCRKIKSFSI